MRTAKHDDIMPDQMDDYHMSSEHPVSGHNMPKLVFHSDEQASSTMSSALHAMSHHCGMPHLFIEA